MIVQFHGLVFLQDESIILNSQGFLDLTVTIVTGRMWIMYSIYMYMYTGSGPWTQEVLLRFIT